MSAEAKTVVIFIGLPYTGKTTLIQRLQERCSGEAIYADALFNEMTPPAETSLERWLQAGPRLVERIEAIIQQSQARLFFVELGVMQAKPRTQLVRWSRDQGYVVIPIWCRCDDDDALKARHEARIEEVGAGGRSGPKIEIALDDLYRRIRLAFEEPTTAEGFIEIDTTQRLEDNLEALCRLIER